VILNFKDVETEKVYTKGKSRRFGSIARVAARRLGAISFAKEIEDLRDPPGNRLEALRGDRKGQYSLRINDLYRVCFRWNGKDAEDVEIVDCH
jgi:proteic killer suppression protein